MNKIKKLCFLSIYLLLPIPFLGLWLGGAYSFLLFYVIFAFVPLIDSCLRDSNNPSAEEEQTLLKDPFYKFIVILYVPLQIIVLLFAIGMVATQTLPWYEWLGFSLSIGLLTGGVGITLAHELMHKNNKLEQTLSKILLVTVCYGHFIIEHVRGHHLRVATPEDAATARLGESFYQFLPRTITGSFKSAWNLEKNRLKNKNYPVMSVNNQFLWILGAPLLIILTCGLLAGWAAALFFILQAMAAITLLELVNYIEHYGLQRKKLASGQYEKVGIQHSWNANHWLSNLLLLHLQRHSDHHACGGRPYQILRHQEQAPQLPSGYIGMMLIALIPPLWRRIMDKRVFSFNQMRLVTG